MVGQFCDVAASGSRPLLGDVTALSPLLIASVSLHVIAPSMCRRHHALCTMCTPYANDVITAFL